MFNTCNSPCLNYHHHLDHDGHDHYGHDANLDLPGTVEHQVGLPLLAATGKTLGAPHLGGRIEIAILIVMIVIVIMIMIRFVFIR